MLQAPWDDRLWSVLSSTPEKVNSQTIDENLFLRRNFRLRGERSRPDEEPLMPVPPSGEWSGEFQDMPCIANEEHAVQYELTFKANGAIQGTCVSAEGDFNINGVYNLRTGIVAWTQFPCNPRPNAKGAEFYGDVSFVAHGPARITGTFLTPTGRYCIVNLTHPSASAGKVHFEVDVSPGNLREEPPRRSSLPEVDFNPYKLPAREEPARRSSLPALPTLLTGGFRPVTAEKPSFLRKYVK